MTDPHSPQTLAQMIRASAPLLDRFVRGFDEASHTAATAGLPNHPIWILGHCAFTMARFGQLIGGDAPDAADFSGDPHEPLRDDQIVNRYCTADIKKDSTPCSDASRYPSLARGREIFAQAAENLARTLEALPATRLAQTIPWNDGPQRIDALAMRLCFHNGMHAGQLTDLRRVLGFERILPIS